MAASCWRSRNSRWVLSMPSRTSSRIFSETSSSARCSRAHSTDALEPGDDVGGLEQVALLLQGQVGRVAGQVGELGGVLDALHRVDHLPGVAALQDRHHQPLVLGRQFARLLGRLGILDRGRLDPQRGAGSADAGADTGTRVGAQDGRRRAAGEPAELLDLGHRSVGGVAVGKPRCDQQLPVRAGLRRVDDGLGGVVQLDRDDHARQHHGVGQRQDRQIEREVHRILFLESCWLKSEDGANVPGADRRQRTATSSSRAPVRTGRGQRGSTMSMLDVTAPAVVPTGVAVLGGLPPFHGASG